MLDVWLQRILAGRQTALLHGAAFRVRSQSVLAVGGRRAGKSTIAAAVILGGGSVVSDDWVLAGVGSGSSVILAPGRIELVFRHRTVAILPDGVRQRRVSGRTGTSDIWSLGPSTADSWYVGTQNPTSIWWLSIDRRLAASRIHPITQAETFAALTRSTSAVFLSPLFQRERLSLLDLLRRLVATCPGFRVRLGRDLLPNPATSLDRLVVAADAAHARMA